MNNINSFIDSFFTFECEFLHSYIQPNISIYNKNLEVYNSYFIDEFDQQYAKLSKAKKDSFYEKRKNKPKPAPRHLFKLSHYKHEKYGELYLAYVSNTNANEYALNYTSCYFISEIKNEFKIIKEYFIATDESDYSKYWQEGEGIQNLTFDTAGKFISCERYLEPEDCEFSMQDYLQDK